MLPGMDGQGPVGLWPGPSEHREASSFFGEMFWLGCLFFHFLKQKWYFSIIGLTETTPQKNGFCRAEDAVLQ